MSFGNVQLGVLRVPSWQLAVTKFVQIPHASKRYGIHLWLKRHSHHRTLFTLED